MRIALLAFSDRGIELGERIDQALTADTGANNYAREEDVNTVTVENGKIAITASTCPGSDCVHSGWAHRAGQAIICLPNRVEIRLIGTAGSGDIDAVAG